MYAAFYAVHRVQFYLFINGAITKKIINIHINKIDMRFIIKTHLLGGWSLEIRITGTGFSTITYP